MTLFKSNDGSDKVDTVSEISNVTSIQSDFEVQSESQSPVEDNYIQPIKAEQVIEMLSDIDDEEPSSKKLKLSIDLKNVLLREKC